jgi:hypothetical protein
VIFTVTAARKSKSSLAWSRPRTRPPGGLKPTEFLPRIGDIEPGMKVSVVNSRDGCWLEIHSKHGRPPGFIRRDVAARVADQN